jgi:hypothetical protein
MEFSLIIIIDVIKHYSYNSPVAVEAFFLVIQNFMGLAHRNPSSGPPCIYVIAVVFNPAVIELLRLVTAPVKAAGRVLRCC